MMRNDALPLADAINEDRFQAVQCLDAQKTRNPNAEKRNKSETQSTMSETKNPRSCGIVCLL